VTDLPRLIVHNSITLNGGLDGFKVDFDLHYGIAGQYHASAYMVGSQTILDAESEIPEENDQDRSPPESDPIDQRPFWVVVDSRGRLEGILHFYRRMPYIKDIIVLVSGQTPGRYIQYLEKRHYPMIRTGTEQVDTGRALHILKEKFQVETILVDSGETLSNLLIEEGFVDAISLVIAPVISTDLTHRLFKQIELKRPVKLKIKGIKKLKGDHLHLEYKILKNEN